MVIYFLISKHSGIKLLNGILYATYTTPRYENGPITDNRLFAAQVESLRSELRTAQGDLQEARRSSQLAQAELGSLRHRLDAKERALEEALADVQRLSSDQSQGQSMEVWRTQRIDKLHAEVRYMSTNGCQSSIMMWLDICMVARL